MGLTPKQQAFADDYIKNGNATEAAIKAGYNKNYASTNTDKLLKNTKVREYIDKQLKKIGNENIAEAEEVLRYLTSIMRGEGVEEVVVVVAAGDGSTTPRIVKKAINQKDRIKAAELIGKRYRMFTENIDLKADVGVQIVDDI